jgi:hypothetical protein
MMNLLLYSIQLFYLFTKSMNNKVSLIIAAFILSSGLYAQTRKYSNEFLNIGVGARALGMSNAFTARVNDVTAGYWNPAGLTQMEGDFQVGLMHSEYFAGIAKYDYGGFATRIDEKSVLGVSVLRFAVDDIPNTTQLIDQNGNVNYANIKSFTAADYAFLISYAREMGITGLSLGGNVKVIYRNVGDFANAYGFGLDFSALYKKDNWAFSAVAKDITSTFNAWSYTLDDQTEKVFIATGNDLPENGLEITLPQLILGAGRLINFGEKFSAFTELDLGVTFDGERNDLISSDPISISPRFGLELAYQQFIFLRGGIGNFQKEQTVLGVSQTTFQPNFGVGVKFKGFSIDYALTDIGDQSASLYSNVFSLRIDLNKKGS